MIVARHPLALLVALAALLVLPPPRASEAMPTPVRVVREELHGRLHELAKWCTARKLFGERYELYELVVSLWPDDETARTSNGYERVGAGWSPQGRKRPSNLSAGGLPALRTMQEEMATWYTQAIEQACRELPPEMAAAWRARARSDAVGIAPDSETRREQNGETKGKRPDGKTGWILIESQRSRERRPMLLKAAQKALKGAPKAKPGSVLESEKSSTVSWSTALEGGLARLTGITDPGELEQVLRNVDASFTFFRAAFDREPGAFHGLTIHVVDDTAKGNVYLSDQPGVEREWLRFVTPLIAVWVPQSARVMVKSPDPTVRLEAGPRMVMGAHMGARFGVQSRMGWAVEGFGLYLTWHLTGTRMINSVRESQYGEPEEKADLAKRLKESGADWFAEARALIASPHAPDLRLLLGKTVNTMTPEDVLYSYLVAMYLVEGQHEALGALLPAVSAVKDAEYDLPFATHLGFDIATLEKRIARWVEETANLK